MNSGHLPSLSRYRRCGFRRIGFTLKAWRLVPLEVWIIASKKETFQSISFVEDFPWHSLAFNFEELPKSADRADYLPMNEWVLTQSLQVTLAAATNDLRKLPELLVYRGTLL